MSAMLAPYSPSAFLVRSRTPVTWQAMQRRCQPFRTLPSVIGVSPMP
ncbi:MAG: hypothetical protein ACYS0E_23075 [Planctomycetota bacterium]|jgi:hypothetical protein